MRQVSGAARGQTFVPELLPFEFILLQRGRMLCYALPYPQPRGYRHDAAGGCPAGTWQTQRLRAGADGAQ